MEELHRSIAVNKKDICLSGYDDPLLCDG